MHEIFPVIAGAAAGLAVQRLSVARLRLIALVVLSVLIGATASLISGELEVSFGFVPVDVAQALLAAVLASALAMAWQHRPARIH